MKGQLPKRFINNIVERPECLSSNINSQKYDDLAETLKIMEATKSVVLDEHEAIALFGKYWRTTLPANMKKRGIEKPRTAIKNGKVYLWSTKI